MTAATPKEVWAAGDAYEPYVGRWSRRVAPEFLAWLAAPAEAGWLDIGCGTGALTRTILERSNPRSVVGVEPSEGFLSHARATIDDARAEFRIGDALALPVVDAAFDVVVSGLVLNFVADTRRALSEMRRVGRPRAIIAAYVWDYADKMELMRYFWDAAVALDAAAGALDEGKRFPICQPAALEGAFRAAGFAEVGSRAIDVPTRFRDFDDYWSPFLGGQGPAPGYAMSLSEERRGALRERIRSMLPIAADGSIDLIARAWAVRGVVEPRANG
jgi:SAM-dependent methyltransferase